MLLVLRVKTELSEVGTSAEVGENDFFRLKVLIVADRNLGVADLRRLIVVLSSFVVVNLVWLPYSSFTFSRTFRRDSGQLRLLAFFQMTQELRMRSGAS